MISGKAKVCGLIANPVEHSLSPMMQNFYAEKTGVDFVYVPFHVKHEDIGAAITGAYALNLAGMNVSVPHKQHVIPYLSHMDDDARAIGAVNTLVRTEDGYKGCNTDSAGLHRAMREAGIAIKGQDCILIGAGGAAKAAAYLLVKEGARIVYILNRDAGRAQALAEEFNTRFSGQSLVPMALSDYGKIPAGSYLAIQSTSVGMDPAVDSAPIEDPAFYQNIHTGVDIIYTPMKTRFMQYVTEAGGKTMNGLTMLLYQGIAAFELWNPQVKVSDEVIAQAKERMTDQLKG